MTIQKGDRLPDVPITIAASDGPKPTTTGEYFAGKRVALFAVPGAFTPTCSAKHLPGYLKELPALKAKGVDLVACLAVNDHWVMKAWAEQHEALGKITMLADGSGAFSKALGIDIDLTKAQMGLRCGRGVFVIEDGTVKSVEMEAAGKFEVSSAEACLIGLKKSA